MRAHHARLEIFVPIVLCSQFIMHMRQSDPLAKLTGELFRPILSRPTIFRLEKLSAVIIREPEFALRAQLFNGLRAVSVNWDGVKHASIANAC